MSNDRNYSCIQPYTLIAQTPLIHFQYDQEGATLRASEVKPKLDAFLRAKAAQSGMVIPEEWQVKETAALNYKLRFTAVDKDGNALREITPITIGRNTPYDIYYGNMGENTREVKAVKNNVQMTVICGVSKLVNGKTLMAFIKENLAAFFLVTNFGRMQNKGFGGFIIKDDKRFSNEKFISKTLAEEYGAPRVYYFEGGSENQIFKRIKVLYTLMKSGSVLSRPPAGSLLFDYLDEYNGLTNERTWLKKEVVARKPSGNQLKYRYVRALLGVGDHIDFGRPINASVKISSEKIERLASPILFKVLPDIKGNRRVYYVARRIQEDIYGADFTFSSSKGSGNCCVPTKEELITSSGEDFIDDFLYYCFDEFNNTDVLDRFNETNGMYIYIGGEENGK